MTGRVEQIRMVAGIMEDDTVPFIAGAVSNSLWELIDDEEWQDIRRAMIAATGVRPEDYDWQEIIVDFDRAALSDAVGTPHLSPQETVAAPVADSPEDEAGS